MGNTNALAYDIVDQVEFKSKIAWTLHDGLKKSDREEQRESVSLFRLSKTQHPGDVALAQRAIQKLRTLKHPFVLKFIETAEMDDSLALVTEPCIPLETWITKTKMERAADSQDKEETDIMLQEVLWGLKCVLMATKFIHESCQLLHGNLGLHSVFVTPNGDWKLAGLELACNVSVPGDVDHFLRHAHLLDNVYCAPERLQRESLCAKVPPYYVDMYSFGQCVQRAFALMDLDMPRSYQKYLTSMLQADMRKRPTAQKLAESAMFGSEHLAFIESIGELALKEPKEFLEVVGRIEPKLAGLSRAVCAHKILPNLARTLQHAINDFPLRDARESCRQSIQVSVGVLAKLAGLGKIDAGAFRQSWVPILVQLWAMSDRTVRTVMLQTLKALVPFIPAATVNRNIFENMLGGFSDSAPKLREATLMSLIFVVDKLEEAQLQDRLVRAVTNLQNDAEPSIRTNATIFLGKIAASLKEPVRVRVLCVAFQKAMKDNFLHCRVAGLRTANACVKLLDVAQVATKIVPQASILVLDKSAEVRSLALTLIESCLELLRAYHSAQSAQSEKGGTALGSIASPGGGSRLYADSPSTPTTSKTASSADLQAQAESSAGGWSSWSVLQGLSKTLESATIVAPAASEAFSSAMPAQQPASAASYKAGGAVNSALAHQHSRSSSAPPPMPSAASRGFSDDIDELDDDYDQDRDRDRDSRQSAPAANKGGSAWDDDMDLNLGDDDDAGDDNRDGGKHRVASSLGSSWGGGSTAAAPSVSSSASSQSRSSIAALKTTAGSAALPGTSAKPGAATAGTGLSGTGTGAAKTGAAGSTKASKVAVTKLQVDKDEGWDDF